MPIALRHRLALGEVPTDKVYFAFGDGRFAYDCRTCGAQCCRGHGYFVGVTTALERHISSRPFLPLFVGADERGETFIRNLTPGCFFLSENGLCDIHRQEGHAAKPETCRLFPFNTIRRLGHYLIVTPHGGLCPLSVVPAGNTSGCSKHEVLLSEMMSQGIAAPLPQCNSERSMDAAIDLERRILALSETCLAAGTSYAAFTEAQIASTGDARVAPTAHDVRGLIELGHEVLGTPSASVLGQRHDVVQTCIAATPWLRSRIAFQPIESVSAHRVSVADIPHVVLCLYLIAEAAAGSGTSAVTLQSLLRLEQEFGSVMRLFPLLNRPVRWRPDASVDIGTIRGEKMRAAFIRMVKMLLPVRGAKPHQLADVLLAQAPKSPWERTLFLKQAATLLQGRVVTVEENGRFSRPTPWKVRAQQWVWARTDTSTLEKVYNVSPSVPPGGATRSQRAGEAS